MNPGSHMQKNAANVVNSARSGVLKRELTNVATAVHTPTIIAEMNQQRRPHVKKSPTVM